MFSELFSVRFLTENTAQTEITLCYLHLLSGHDTSELLQYACTEELLEELELTKLKDCERT